MLAFEIGKYQHLGRRDIVAWYESHPRGTMDLSDRITRIRSSLDCRSVAQVPRG